jgi:hypothetical protein
VAGHEDEKDAATSHLTEARLLFVRLNAPIYAERTQNLAGRLGIACPA